MTKISNEALSPEEKALLDAVRPIEEAHYPIGPPDLAEAIKFRMEQEREENELGETTLTIGSAEDMPDGYLHADKIYLDGSIGIPVTPQADLCVVGVVRNGDVLDDEQKSLLALPLLSDFLGKTVEVTVRVLKGFPHGKGDERERA